MDPPVAPSGREGSADGARLGPYVALVLLGILPLVGLGILSYRFASDELREIARRGNRTAATIAQQLVEREFDHWISTIAGISRLPQVVDAVATRDEDGVRRRLRVFVEAHPRVIRAFVTDPSGLLWTDYPRAPESLGRRFDYRDWYRGLSEAWEPYVSEVYRRHAHPQLLLVAVAAPVRDDAGEVIGALVLQVRLEELSDLLEQVEVGAGGYVLLLDHTGSAAAHPRLDLQARVHDEYAPLVEPGLPDEGRGGPLAFRDPASGEEMLATALPCTVGTRRWTVISQQPLRAALGAVDVLRRRILGAGAVLAILVGGLCLGLGRFHVRLRRLAEDLAAENRERVRAEEALQAINEDLEARVEERTRELRETELQLHHSQRLESLGLLAGGIAHDFNNLLSVIVGHCDLTLEELPEDAPASLRTSFEEIRAAEERGSALTRQLLAFGRKQVLRPRVLDLTEVVTGMEDMLSRLLGERVRLEVDLGEDLHPVEFDPVQLEQVLMNLAVNARDAMPEGGTLTLRTRNVDLDEDYARRHPGARAGPHVMLAVTDTGTGMDEETRRQVFEPFFTTKELGRGTGLGLSTVYGIVKQGGGNIWIYSEPGKGTTFKVYLPRTERSGETVAPARPEREVPKGSGRVLVVEDDPALRLLLETVIEKGGYEVVVAEDAERALEHLDAASVDLVLSDMGLPGLDGGQLVEELRRRGHDARVVLTSGYTHDMASGSGSLPEVDAFLEKPVHPEELLGTLARVLGGSSSG